MCLENGFCNHSNLINKAVKWLVVDFLCVCVCSIIKRNIWLNSKHKESLQFNKDHHSYTTPHVKTKRSEIPSFKFLCVHNKYYRKDSIGLLLNPYMLTVNQGQNHLGEANLSPHSNGSCNLAWILALTFSIFQWALVKQSHFLIANPACLWWDLTIKPGPFQWSPATKPKKPNPALCNFNCFEWMAGIKSRSLSSKCNLVNSSAGDPRYGGFSKSFSHRMPLENYKGTL